MPDLSKRPNILMIMVDQMRFPRFGYGDEHGFAAPLKRIFGFQASTAADDEYRRLFPGLTALRDNAVVFRSHRTGAAACVPSRGVIFTGQYGTITGVTETDGMFKDGNHQAFRWLAGDEFPTIGDWLGARGYSCHYFGKWHLSVAATQNLREYGFLDWELGYPDPHGGSHNNLGYYRDYQFRDLVTSFLRRQGLGAQQNLAEAAHRASPMGKKPPINLLQETPAQPWFAVASFTNPHDIGLYPFGPRMVCGSPLDGAPYTLAVPPQGSHGNRPLSGTMTIPLNRYGFPQNNSEVPPTWNESLDGKPWCQLESAYKVGLGLGSSLGWILASMNGPSGSKRARLEQAVQIALASNMHGMPLALTPDPERACRAFMQYYGYLLHEVDQHINAVLRALEESGQADDTIVVFTSDHGENGGAHHLMTQKFHTAYEETIHVPMLVRLPASIHRVPDGLRQIDAPTSHADILPTLLGLAGVRGPDEVRATRDILRQTHARTYAPVGADLSELILNDAATIVDPKVNAEREGVLFMTHDRITEPLGADATDVSDIDDESQPLTRYDVYLEAIERLRSGRAGGPQEVTRLAPGSIRQPCQIHAVVTKDGWKLVRYFAPEGRDEIADQFEFYDLNTDPSERYNLLVFDGAFPTPVDQHTLPANQQYRDFDIADKARSTMALLRALEERLLTAPETS